MNVITAQHSLIMYGTHVECCSGAILYLFYRATYVFSSFVGLFEHLIKLTHMYYISVMLKTGKTK